MEINTNEDINKSIENKIPLCLHYWKQHKKLWRKHFDALDSHEQNLIFNDNNENTFVKQFHAFIISQTSKLFLDPEIETNKEYSWRINRKSY